MDKRQEVNNNYDTAHDLLFSCNIAWAVVWYERITGHPFWSFVTKNSHLPKSLLISHTEPWAIVQVLWSIVLGTVVFIGLRLAERVWKPGSKFRALTGIFAIGTFPLFTLFLYLRSLSKFTDLFAWYHPHIFLFLAIGELSAALLCGIAYYLRRWLIPPGPSVALLGLHFGLWAWLTGNWTTPKVEMQVYSFRDFGISILISSLFYFGFPLIGFLATVAWAKHHIAVDGRSDISQ